MSAHLDLIKESFHENIPNSLLSEKQMERAGRKTLFT